MIKPRTREELYDLFRQGAIPSGADFADFIKSQLNLLDDGLGISESADDPLCFRAHGEAANYLDLADTDGDLRWRISGYDETISSEGLNLSADQQSKLFIERETGNVGINIDRPEAKLHIIQISATDALRIDDAGNDQTPLIVTSEGQVGLGTDSPNAKLHLSYSGSGDILRVDDTDSDTTPLIIDDTGNVGVGYSDPQAKLTVAGGMAIGVNYNPGGNNLYVAGNIEVTGSTVFSGGPGVGGIEINAPLTSKTKEITLKDNVIIIGDADQDGSDGNLSVAGDTTLGIYQEVYENQNVLTVNGRIQSGYDSQSGAEQYELELNKILTVDRTPASPQAKLNGALTVTGNATMGDTQADNIYLNGVVSSKVGGVVIDDDLTVSGTVVLGDALDDKVILNGQVSSNLGKVIINDNLQVTGNVSLGDSQTDNIYLNGIVNSSVGDVIINDNLSVSGATVLGDFLSDTVVLNGKVKSNLGDVIIDDNLQVTGNVSLGDSQTDNIYLNGTVSSAVGDLIFDANLNVKGSVVLGDSVADNVVLNGRVSSNVGDLIIDDNLTVSGTATLSNAVINGAISSNTGAVNIADSVNITSDLNINGAMTFANSGVRAGGLVTVVDNLDDTVLPTEGAVKRYVDASLSNLATQLSTVNNRFSNFVRDVRYVSANQGYTRNRAWGDGHWSYVDIYPPSGYTMSNLLYYSVSPRYIPFDGDVDDNDTLACWAIESGSFIRCYVGNSEQREYGIVAFYGLWFK
jgi:hypothetical protein